MFRHRAIVHLSLLLLFSWILLVTWIQMSSNIVMIGLNLDSIIQLLKDSLMLSTDSQFEPSLNQAQDQWTGSRPVCFAGWLVTQLQYNYSYSISANLAPTRNRVSTTNSSVTRRYSTYPLKKPAAAVPASQNQRNKQAVCFLQIQPSSWSFCSKLILVMIK